MTTPLPMRISVANLIDQEGCFVTLNGGKSRPSAVKIIKEALRLCSAQTCKTKSGDSSRAGQPPRTFTIR
jgi:hypothetical protein